MALTLEQAKSLTPGTILVYHKAHNADKTLQRWKVIGKPKTWKTRPNEVQISLKHGLRHFATINQNDLEDFSLGGHSYY